MVYIYQGYGFQQEQEILVSWFFEFLVSWQEMGDKKQEIDFLHFLVNFDQIVGLFDDFISYNDENTYFPSFQDFFGLFNCISLSFGSRKFSSLDLVCSKFTNL